MSLIFRGGVLRTLLKRKRSEVLHRLHRWGIPVLLLQGILSFQFIHRMSCDVKLVLALVAMGQYFKVSQSSDFSWAF